MGIYTYIYIYIYIYCIVYCHNWQWRSKGFIKRNKCKRKTNYLFKDSDEKFDLLLKNSECLQSN